MSLHPRTLVHACSPLSKSRANLQRQLAEVEALQSIYSGEGEFNMTSQEKAVLQILGEPAEDGPVPEALGISFTINVTSTEVGGQQVRLRFFLPSEYPEKSPVRVFVECGGETSRQQHEAINKAALTMAENLVGEEAILQVIQRESAVAWEIQESQREEFNTEISITKPASSVSKLLDCTLIWFHHIKSLQKRKSIIDWGQELGLGGYCKPGFPGILLFEGEGDDVAEYIRRLQRLRWQAMSIRGKEQQELAVGQDLTSVRRFAVGIRELDENGMSELSTLCREAHLEGLFLSGLKIHRSDK